MPAVGRLWPSDDDGGDDDGDDDGDDAHLYQETCGCASRQFCCIAITTHIVIIHLSSPPSPSSSPQSQSQSPAQLVVNSQEGLQHSLRHVALSVDCIRSSFQTKLHWSFSFSTSHCEHRKDCECCPVSHIIDR